MWIELPRIEMTNENSCVINENAFPYSLDFYDSVGEGEVRTLKVVLDEICDIVRRYVILYPATVRLLEEERWTGFRCLVNDETAGISRGILERLGYLLEESDFTPYGIYWITLKTRIEKRKKK